MGYDYSNDPDVGGWQNKIDSFIQKEGIDLNSPKADYIRATYGQESKSGSNTKTSNRGAAGGLQVLPKTFKEVYPEGDFNNPDHLMTAGVRYASQAHDVAKGDPRLAATYYYGGPNGYASALKGIPVSDPKNPDYPNTFDYANQLVKRMPVNSGNSYENDPDVSGWNYVEQPSEPVIPKTIKDISAFSNNKAIPINEESPQIKVLGRRLAEDITKPLNEMSWEDFKRKSVIAPAATYVASSLGLPGFTEKDKEEAVKNLEEKGSSIYKAVKNVANMPVQDFSQGVVNAGKQLIEHPGTFIGESAKGTIYDPEMLVAGQGVNAVTKPILGAGKKLAGAIGEAAMQEPKIASGVNAIKAGTSQAKNQLNESFANIKQQFNEPQSSVTVTGAPNVGAAMVDQKNAVNALIPNLSSDTANLIKSVPPEKVNLPALETKAIEDTHGIKLSQGQRIGDNSRYANEWNARDTNSQIQKLFSEQPQQFVDAFEKIKDKHSSDIGELTKENIGQLEINALAAKDKMRTDAIDKAYQDLKDQWQMLRGTSGTDDFPVNGKEFLINSNAALKSELLHHDVPESISKILSEIANNDGKMGFSEFLKLNQKLGQKMKEGNGSERAAAFTIRQELQKIPLQGEAAQLQPLANKAIALAKERFDVIKTNPAYKTAIKEATDAKDAGSMESLNAANFHDKFVTGKTATPEAVRRMIDEIHDNVDAMKAIRAGDILNAENALVPNKMTPQLRPDAYNKYLRSQAEKTKYIHSPESAQDLLDIGILSSKVAKPAENVFNYSNSYSAYLGDLLKHGVQLKGEGLLAAATKGASIPVVAGGKELFKHYSSRKFANETTHPHSGLVNKE